MNRTDLNSFQIQEIEIDTLREQLVRLQSENKSLKDAFKFLQGEVVGKALNTSHPSYSSYIQILQKLTT
jgi:hypothetical protein